MAEALSAAKIFPECRRPSPPYPTCRGVNDISYLTNSPILQLEHAAASFGGGLTAAHIRLEFAQMFRRFGSEVTVIEKARA